MTNQSSSNNNSSAVKPDVAKTSEPMPKPDVDDKALQEGFSLSAFGTQITIWGERHFRRLLGFLAVLTVVYVVFQDEANVYVERLINPVKFEQNQKFLLQHAYVSPIIDAWDTIHDIEDRTKKNVKLVRERIDDAVNRYEQLKVDKLSAAAQITWMYHLARLKVIEADKTAKINALEVAINWLDRAKVKSNETDKLSVADMKFINDIGMNTRIKRTKLNTYALFYHISDDIKYYHLAAELLEDIGGCEELISTYLYHVKIANALQCSI